MEGAIRYAKKYYFWPVSLIMLVLALYFWSASTTALDKKFESNVSSYTQSKSSVDGIQTNPPSEVYIKAIQKKTKKLKENVVDTWTNLHKQQVVHDQWPEISGVDFSASQIPNAGCEQYKYRIVEEFKKLTETLHLVAERDKMGVAIDDEIGRVAGAADAQKDTANPDKSTNTNTEDNAETAPAEIKKELVLWPESDIDNIISTHFSWARIPTTLQIHVAQEDFWVFKNLLDAIKTLNEGIETRNVANLREIKSILITHDAADKFAERREKGFFDEKSFVKKGEEDTGMDSGDAAGVGATAEAETAGDGASGDGSSDGMKKEFRELFNGRYVNSDGLPITAGQYFAIKDTAETRSIPVYLSLVIKQDSLSDLLALLINAEKPVDIKLILINPGKGWTPSFDFSRFEDESAETGSDVTTATSDNHGHGTIRSTSRGRGRSGHGSNARGAGNEKDALDIDEIQVDIYGIITLYNPVAEKRFPQSENAVEDIDEEQPQDGDSPESEENGEENDADTEAVTEDNTVQSNAEDSEKNDADDEDSENNDAKSEPAEDAPAENVPAENVPADDAPADAT